MSGVEPVGLIGLILERVEGRHLEDLTALDDRAAVDPHRVELIQGWVADGNCVAAVLDGRTVGYSVMKYHFYERGFVEMLQVHREFRRRGIGTALMKHMRARCTTERLFTSTNLSNRPMQGLLAKLGYRLSTVLPHIDDEDPELLFVHLGR